MIGLRDLAIAAALTAAGYVGTREEGGNNRGDQVEFFQALTGGRPGDSWCADFVFSCLLKAYLNRSGALNVDKEHDRKVMLADAASVARKTGIPRSGAVMDWWRWSETSSRFRHVSHSPLKGDLILMKFDSRPEPHHIGFVEYPPNHAPPGRVIRTVEGNTSEGGAGSQSNGGGVYPKIRRDIVIFGFISMD